MQIKFEDIKGMIFSSVERDGETINFKTEEGEYRLCHHQDCCESVTIEDLNGNLKDLENSPILIAEESSSRDFPQSNKGYSEGSHTWTFYRIFTIKGGVVMR